MSELGAMNFTPQFETTNYSQAFGEPMKISDALQEKVDASIQEFIAAGQKRALSLITQYRKQLDAVSLRLLEQETLDGDEFASLMGQAKAKISEAAVTQV